jgi:Zn-dependent protease with chaperone function
MCIGAIYSYMVSQISTGGNVGIEAISITYSVLVSIDIGNQHAIRMRRIILPSVACLVLTNFFLLSFTGCGPNSSAGIVTGYGLDGPEIESRWGRDFPHLSRRALEPTQPPVQLVPGLSWGKERPGRDADPSPASSAVGHERVKLYIYSPYGSYSLYRATVPVQ